MADWVSRPMSAWACNECRELDNWGRSSHTGHTWICDLLWSSWNVVECLSMSLLRDCPCLMFGTRLPNATFDSLKLAGWLVPRVLDLKSLCVKYCSCHHDSRVHSGWNPLCQEFELTWLWIGLHFFDVIIFWLYNNFSSLSTFVEKTQPIVKMRLIFLQIMCGWTNGDRSVGCRACACSRWGELL